MMLQILIMICSAGVVFFIVSALANLGTGPKFQDRFDLYHSEQLDTSPGVRPMEPTESSFVERFAYPMFDRLSRMSQTMTQQAMLNSTNQRLREAGISPQMTPQRFIGLCLFCGMVVSLFMFWVLSLSENANYFLRIFLPVAMFLPGKSLPMFFLAKRAETRKDSMRKDLPYVMDLLTVSVEAGLGLEAAIAEVSNRTSGPVSREFAQTLREIRLGRSRVDALTDLPVRTGVQELQNIVSAIVHVLQSGGSLSKVLRVQSSSIRYKRKQEAQEMAMKAPVKIIFPLVLFIFPAIFVVILGPTALMILDMLGKK